MIDYKGAKENTSFDDYDDVFFYFAHENTKQ